MEPIEETRRLINELHARVKRSGMSVAEVTDAIGRHRSFFGERKRAGDIKASLVFELLNVLGLTPHELFEGLYPAEHDEIMARLRADVAREPVELDEVILKLASSDSLRT